MSSSRSTANLPNFPFNTFADFQDAMRTGSVSLGVDRYLPHKVVSLGLVSSGALLFTQVFAYCFIWATLPIVIISWSTLGWASLGMFLVALVSMIISRPWSSPIIILLFVGLTIYGFFTVHPLIAWYGLSWVVAWFLTCGMYEWCKDTVRRKLETEEDFFAKLWEGKGICLQMKSGQKIWCDAKLPE